MSGEGREDGQVPSSTRLRWGVASSFRAWGNGNPENGTKSADLSYGDTHSGIMEVDCKGVIKPWRRERGPGEAGWTGGGPGPGQPSRVDSTFPGLAAHSAGSWAPRGRGRPSPLPWAPGGRWPGWTHRVPGCSGRSLGAFLSLGTLHGKQKGSETPPATLSSAPRSDAGAPLSSESGDPNSKNRIPG